MRLTMTTLLFPLPSSTALVADEPSASKHAHGELVKLPLVGAFVPRGLAVLSQSHVRQHDTPIQSVNKP